MGKDAYDAVVVGSGPNGLAAAITLQREGLSVLLIEGNDTIGGGMRSAELTLPGFISDVCSAIHPMAAASPFFSSLPLEEYGLEWIDPPVLAAHPFDDGSAAVLKKDIQGTASLLGFDQENYLRLIAPIVKNWPQLVKDVLGPLGVPAHPFAMAKFGLQALQPASNIINKFNTPAAKGLFAGMAAHAVLPLNKWSTAAIGLVLLANGHLKGWPLPKGGSQQLANALGSYFTAIGGTIQTGWRINSLKELPAAKAVLFDVGTKQLLSIAGKELNPFYRYRLKNYRYGMGVFKVDWALDGPVPFSAPKCREAGTVHIGGTWQEIARSEYLAATGKLSSEPFVLLAQQSLFDTGRAPAGKQVLWGYCHVPNGSMADRTVAIEKQVERFAPGFRDRIISRHTINTMQLEKYNPNYIGGDINGGMMNIGQLFARPVLKFSPYSTGAKGIYICSASTPPGGGVHGMCGYHAARRALADIWQKYLYGPPSIYMLDNRYYVS